MTKTILWGVCAMMLVTSVPTASADTPRPRSQAQRQKDAQAHFERGREFFAFGAYDEAIREYEAAFALMPLADFLFNIGQVYRTKGDREKAISYYRRYLAAAPNGQATSVAQAHIAAMEAELAAAAEAEAGRRRAAEEAAKARQAEEERQRREADDKARLAAKQAADRAVSKALADVEADQKARGNRKLRLAGYAAIGTGLLAAGGGAYFGFRSNSLYDRASSAQGTWTDEHARALEDGDTARTRSYVLTASGGALVLAGAGLWFFSRGNGRANETPENTTLAPVAMPSGAGLVVGGSF